MMPEPILNTCIRIPGKTFLVGEYIALEGGATLIFTSEPYFKLTTAPEKHCPSPFHPDSPAGQWLDAHPELASNVRFQFINPYQRGGLGASTAEFLAVYEYYYHATNQTIEPVSLLNTYQTLFSSHNLPIPSGADLMAQFCHGITYFNRQLNTLTSYHWPFNSLSLILFHTGHKLATHEHLRNHRRENSVYSPLHHAAQHTIDAFTQRNASHFCAGINQYAETLQQLGLTANTTTELLKRFQRHPFIKACKGCGALGADVILLLCHVSHKQDLLNELSKEQLTILATETELAPPKMFAL